MGAHTLQSTLGFGKYAGLTVEGILRFDPGYLSWARKNLRTFDLDQVAAQRLTYEMRRHHEQSFQRQNAWAWGFGKDAKGSADTLRTKLIKIEHEERRKAGQETCTCFPNNWPSCACRGTGWVNAKSEATPS